MRCSVENRNLQRSQRTSLVGPGEAASWISDYLPSPLSAGETLCETATADQREACEEDTVQKEEGRIPPGVECRAAWQAGFANPQPARSTIQPFLELFLTRLKLTVRGGETGQRLAIGNVRISLRLCLCGIDAVLYILVQRITGRMTLPRPGPCLGSGNWRRRPR